MSVCVSRASAASRKLFTVIKLRFYGENAIYSRHTRLAGSVELHGPFLLLPVSGAIGVFCVKGLELVIWLTQPERANIVRVSREPVLILVRSTCDSMRLYTVHLDFCR